MRVVEYVTDDGDCPYQRWLKELDVATRARISARVLRFEEGLLGDIKRLKGVDVFEARFNFGPGYRLYFGVHKRTLVVLLIGGDKSTQRRDIRQAQKFWLDYLEVEHGKTKS